jgi:Zn finger protein HypA/HybF involved in hydrogenase expression
MDTTFLVSVPTDGKGFIGRACDAPGCKQYFKIRIADHKDVLFCPYCGAGFSKNVLLTRDQLEHVQRAAVEEVRVHVAGELQRVFKDAFGGSKYIKYKPGRHLVRRAVVPTYEEREVDTELECAECGTQFQVYGIFGYCPGCKCENLRIYDANWAIIKHQLRSSSDTKRQLRHAYGDLVSTFEVFCMRKAAASAAQKGNFQVLSGAQQFFKTHMDVDILASLKPSQLLALRRVFQKRHVCIHAAGIITDRYVKMIPEDSHLVGSEVLLSESELDDAAQAMRVALGDLVRKIEASGK